MMNFSNLNEHLFNKNCVGSAICACGKSEENTYNFFFACPKYLDQRTILYHSLGGIDIIITPTVNNILNGFKKKDNEANMLLFNVI